MADERDFELLDDYLTNRMSAEEHSAFEQRLQSDQDLQQEYALQKRVIQGIKDARVAQLKSMLNQVSVPPGAAGNAVASKVIIGAVMAIVIAAAALWIYRDQKPKITPPDIQSEQKSNAPVEEPVDTNQSETETPAPGNENARVSESDRNQTSAGTEHSKPSLAKRPDPVSGPAGTNDDSSSSTGAVSDVGSANVVTSDTRYDFHYQFHDGKLTLYGPFEKGGYEIVAIEISGKKTLSLYYQERYYLLDNVGGEPRSLVQVSDPAMLNKLQQQRTSN